MNQASTSPASVLSSILSGLQSFRLVVLAAIEARPHADKYIIESSANLYLERLESPVRFAPGCATRAQVFTRREAQQVAKSLTNGYPGDEARAILLSEALAITLVEIDLTIAQLNAHIATL